MATENKPATAAEPNALQILAEAQSIDVKSYTKGMPIALLCMLDPHLYKTFWSVSVNMSNAHGMVPKHLIGNPSACFAVVTYSLTWRLNPYAVAQSTYQPKDGAKVGFEGKLVQAILERSGRLENDRVEFEHVGDWSKIINSKPRELQSRSGGGTYKAPGWSEADERGENPPAVIVRATIKGESEPRAFRMELFRCQPRNSTLWAHDPMTQICYTAVRRFASVEMPSLLFGIPFDDDSEAGGMVELNPEARPARPAPGDFTRAGQRRQPETVIEPEEPRQAATEPVQRAEADPATSTPPEGSDAAGGQDPGQHDGSGETVDAGDVGDQGDGGDDGGDQGDAGGEPSRFGDRGLDLHFDGWKESLATAGSIAELDALEREWKEWKAADLKRKRAEQAPMTYLQAVNTMFTERRAIIAKMTRGGGRA